jgi:hypothetical protein
LRSLDEILLAGVAKARFRFDDAVVLAQNDRPDILNGSWKIPGVRKVG